MLRLSIAAVLTLIAFASNSVLNRMAVAGGHISVGDFAIWRVASGAITLIVISLIIRRLKVFEIIKQNITLRILGGISLATYMLGCVPDTPGMAYELLGPIGEANIEVDVILQNTGDCGKTDFTFTVSRNDLAAAEKIVAAQTERLGAVEWSSDSHIAKVSPKTQHDTPTPGNSVLGNLRGVL